MIEHEPRDYSFIESLSDDQLRSRLMQRGMSPYVADNLVADRETAGAKWRIAKEIDE